MNTKGMRVREAIEALYRFGSSTDPIIYHGEETTPGDLEDEIDEDWLASNVRIQFYGFKRDSSPSPHNLELLKGTLASMVNQRSRTNHLFK